MANPKPRRLRHHAAASKADAVVTEGQQERHEHPVPSYSLMKSPSQTSAAYAEGQEQNGSICGSDEVIKTPSPSTLTPSGSPASSHGNRRDVYSAVTVIIPQSPFTSFLSKFSHAYNDLLEAKRLATERIDPSNPQSIPDPGPYDYTAAFASLNITTGLFGVDLRRGAPKPRILDLCSSPNGWAATIREQMPALGMPWSLASPSLRDSISNHLADRTVFADLTPELALDPNLPLQLFGNSSFQRSFHAESGLFDVIITNPLSQSTSTNMIATLVLALRLLRHGGALVLSLTELADLDKARTVVSLAHFCAHARLHKPPLTHAWSGSFYVVAMQVDKQCAEAHAALERWCAQIKGEAPPATNEDESDDAFTRACGLLLADRGRDVWAVQARGLREILNLPPSTSAPSEPELEGWTDDGRSQDDAGYTALGSWVEEAGYRSAAGDPSAEGEGSTGSWEVGGWS